MFLSETMASKDIKKIKAEKKIRKACFRRMRAAGRSRYDSAGETVEENSRDHL